MSLLALLLVAQVGSYGSSQLDSQWSRTPIPFKTFTITDVGADPEVVTSSITGSAVAVLWTIPAQAKVTCTPDGGSHFYACWSQDPAPDISENLYWESDADGVYTDGNGPCAFAVSGTPYLITGVVPSVFRPQFQGGAQPPGSRKGICNSTRQPCAADGECSTGTCNLTPSKYPDTVYLFVGCADTGCACVIEDVR